MSSLANPLAAVFLGAAAGLYLPRILSAWTCAAAIAPCFAFLLAAAGIAAGEFPFFPVREPPSGGGRFRRAGAAWVVLAAAGLFAGAAVGRGLDSRRAAEFFGLPQEDVVRIEGRALLDSRPRRGGGSLLAVRVVRCGDRRGNSASASADMVAVFPEESRFFWGDAVTLDGRVAAAGDGSRFFFVLGGKSSGARRGSPLFAVRAEVLLRALDRIGSFRERWTGLFAALFLGVQDDLDPAVADAFRRAGVVHILALSGMHLGILAVLLRLLMRPFFGGGTAGLLCAAAVGCYTFLAGPRPSLLRAASMFLLHEALTRAGRRPETASLLAFSFLGSCFLTPGDLYSASFVLSHLAMGGILFFSRRIRRFMLPVIPEPLASAAAVSVAAQLAAAPYLLAVFGTVHPAAVPASVLLGPLTAAFLWVGVPGCVLAGIPPSAETAAQGFLFPMKYLYTAIVATAEFFARFPAWGGG